MASTKYPVLRQTLIIFSFLAIVGLFFALNHFILIPQQQQSYNNKIFRALQVVSADFEKTLDGQADYFAKNRNSTSYSDETFLSTSGSLKQKIIDSFKKLNRTIVTTKYKRRFDFKTDTVSLLLLEDSIQKFDTAIAFRDVLEPTIQHLHKDLFDLVMLVNRDTVFTEKKHARYMTGFCTNMAIWQRDTFFPAIPYLIVPALGSSVPSVIFPLQALHTKPLPYHLDLKGTN